MGRQRLFLPGARRAFAGFGDALITRLERFPIRWNHPIEKELLRFKELEHVLIEKVSQLFRNMLWATASAAGFIPAVFLKFSNCCLLARQIVSTPNEVEPAGRGSDTRFGR